MKKGRVLHPSSCHKASRRYPDPKALPAIIIHMWADPCPLQTGNQSTHIAELENQRASKVYEVEFYATSILDEVYIDGKHEWLHSSKVVRRGGNCGGRGVMTRRPGTQGSDDEIQCVVSLFDATQRTANGFRGQREKTELSYDIQLA